MSTLDRKMALRHRNVQLETRKQTFEQLISEIKGEILKNFNEIEEISARERERDRKRRMRDEQA